MAGEQQRQDPRAVVDLEVRYRSAQEFKAAYSTNISGGGLFIRTQQPLPLNQPLRIRFSLPGLSRYLVIHAVVVWTNPHPSRSSYPSGMGVKFVDLDPAVKEIISRYVKERLAAAATPPAKEKESEKKKPQEEA